MDSVLQNGAAKSGAERPRRAGEMTRRRRGNLGILCSCSVAAIVASLATDAAAAAAAEAASASRSTALGEVVVTARRREENVQSVPAAITAITEADLQAKQVTTQNDLRFIAPSLSIQGRFGHQGGTYAVRGLSGSTSGSATVGTYFAEVPSAQGAAGYDVAGGTSLYDLESVQVLKGPQGTLFGRTSTAGAVLVTPRKPSMESYRGDAELTAGSLGRLEVNLGFGGPIIPGVLAARVALNDNHVDGYTKIIGTGQKLDETDTRSYRVSVEFTPTDWLRNSTIYDDYRSDSMPGSFLTVGVNAALPNFNLPANTTAFNAACATAVSAGLAASVPACVAQRLSILAQIKADLIAEVARTSAGGDALRRVNIGTSAPYREVSNRQVLVNTTTVTLPSVGAFEWQFKNIFGYQRLTGFTVFPESSNANPTILTLGSPGGASNNQFGNQLVTGTGDGYDFYTNEAQVSGSFDKTRLVWVAGYFYQRAPLPTNLAGLTSLSKTFGGVATYNLGYTAGGTFPVSGRSTQKAYYGQATLSLDGLIDGVHITAGYRHSRDSVTSTSAPAVLNTATGAYTPSATRTTAALKTSGDGYNFSVDYQVTPSVLVYATTRRGYVPGGLNNQVAGATSIPNYRPTYGSEVVKDYEVGAKADFQIADMRGRLNVAYYRENYTDIQRSQQGQLPTGAFLVFTANVAKAKLSGFESELTLEPTSRSLIGINYSYNKTGYTKWMGNDALNIAPAGTVLDLSTNPFPNAPKHKLSVNASYDVVQSDKYGTVTIGGQAYAQSREYWTAFSQRFIDVYGPATKASLSQSSYVIFNARVDWADVMGHEGVGAGLFVRNITDKIYTSSGLVNLNSNGWAGKTFSEPRTYGAVLSYHF